MTAPHKGNAARPPMSLIGRREAAAAITARIADGARLVTITGPGGIGKTRLLRELIADHAEEMSAHGSGGAWWIDATYARSSAELCATIAATLRIRGVGGRDPVGALGRALRRMQRVLVGLDNLEQLGDEAAVALRSWLQVAPAAQFVATTRIPVNIEGQELWPLAPLAVPGRGATQLQLEASEAWQLFIARLRAIMPSLELTAELAADVGEIVRRVDGVPLAIELAAARAKVLTPAQICERLANPLDLLVRTNDEGRHGSMRRTIADSVAMLPGWARPCVDALGAFAGSIELDAMTAVLASTGVDAAAALEALCDHGLIVRALDTGRWTGRFAVFEPVRQLAGELADQHAVSSKLAIAHAHWYAQWACELLTLWATDPDAARVAVARHLDNVLAAIRVAVGAAALFDEAAQMVLAIDPHLGVEGQHRRRVDLLGIVLAGPLAPTVEATLRLARGSAHRELGELDAALGDWHWIDAHGAMVLPRDKALALGRRAELVEIEGRTDEAMSMLSQALELLGPPPRAPADLLAEAELTARRAHALRREGQLDQASSATARAFALFTQIKQREGVAAMLYESAVISLFCREDEAAERGFTDAIDLATEIGARMQTAAARSALGILVQSRGQIDRAITLLAESAREFRDLGHLHREGSALYSLASAYLERGDVKQALIVHMQAITCIDAIGAARYQALLASLAALAHARLGAWLAADAAVATAEAAEARCRRESSLRAVLDITRLRLSHRDAGHAYDRCIREARAIADTTPGDDPQLFARLVASDRPTPIVTGSKGSMLSVDTTGGMQLGNVVLDLTKRLPLRRIVVALAERRVAAPGEAVSLAALVEAGWPGERIRSDAAINRVHVALSTLRRLGLRDVIVSGEHGYMIDPALRVEIHGTAGSQNT